MTSTWPDDYESEAFDDSEVYEDSEGEYDSEAYYSSDPRSDAMRRARARRIVLARRRMALARAGRVPSPTPPRRVTPTQAVSAIRNLDLQTKVTEDSLRSALERSNSRARRNMYVTVASTAVDQALDSFSTDLVKHDFVRAGARFAPLLLLAPERRRKGLEGWALDPRVLGAAGMVGIVAAGRFHHRSAGVGRIVVSNASISLSAVANGKFAPVVVDKDGATVSVPVVFGPTTDSAVLTVDADGNYTALRKGRAQVLVRAGDFFQDVDVRVRK
jgi:hypothetical protein